MTVLLIILVLALLGAPLFVIVGAATAAAFATLTGDIHSFNDLGGWMIDPFESLMGRDQFLAIPLFIASGAIMTEGGMARRLVEFARAALGWMPGGLGITAVFACMVFAAITGSSPVTLIAVGSIMYPAMTRAGYPENFSLGLVMTAGSLSEANSGSSSASMPSTKAAKMLMASPPACEASLSRRAIISHERR